MNPIRKTFLVAAVLAAVAGGVLDAQSAAACPDCRNRNREARATVRHNRYGQWERHRAERFRRLARELGLTREQRAKIRDIFEQGREDMAPMRRQLLAERRAVRELARGGSAGDDAIRGQVRKVAAIEADLAVRRAKTFRDLRAVLTPDQLERFQSLRDRRPDDRPGRGRQDPEERD